MLGNYQKSLPDIDSVSLWISTEGKEQLFLEIFPLLESTDYAAEVVCWFSPPASRTWIYYPHINKQWLHSYHHNNEGGEHSLNAGPKSSIHV